MKTYICSATVIGGKFIGEFRANSADEALKKAWKKACVSLCHQCSGEVENAEIDEIHIECDGEDVTPQSEDDTEIARLRAEVERLQADAKLGRMVRGMPTQTYLRHGRWSPNKWVFIEEYDPECADDPGLRRAGSGDTPEDALEKAMGEGK